MFDNRFAVSLLPRSGFANRLFVWARGYIFASHHSIPHYTHGWANIRFGQFLRMERSHRFYYVYVESDTNHSGLLAHRILATVGRSRVSTEPADLMADLSDSCDRVWIFRGVPWYEDYFAGLRGHEQTVKAGFRKLVKSKYLNAGDSPPAPEISLHIRRGDFQIGRDLSSNEYFIRAVNALRESANRTVPVTVFSDALDEEIHDVLTLPDVKRHHSINDVSDMVLMSRSKVIVTSLHSTYGYWAAYLSNAAVVLDPRHGCSRIRDDQPKWIEGPIDDVCETIAAQRDQEPFRKP